MQMNLKKMVCVIRDNIIASPTGIIILLLRQIHKNGDQHWDERLRLIPIRANN
jgi:hypothetical protein